MKLSDISMNIKIGCRDDIGDHEAEIPLPKDVISDIKQLFLELIGLIHVLPPEKPNNIVYRNEARAELRAELRKKIQEEL